MNMHNQIKLVIGPMFAGKSSYLLAEERKSLIAKKKVVCIKHSLDYRYTSGSEIVTHNQHTSTAPSYAASTLAVLMDVIVTNGDYDVVLIDEGQFFPDLDIMVETLAQCGKYVVVAALSSDFKRQGFEPIQKLIPKADVIVQLTAICTKCGNDAPFTYRIHSHSSDSQTLIGGAETYEPRCRKCFMPVFTLQS